MGANEKHAATYHGGEYTPSTDSARRAYLFHTAGLKSPPQERAERREHEFDRWLAKIRAEAKAEALNEAAHALDSATINIEMLNGDPDLKQAWVFRGSERKSIIQSLRIRADRHKENQK